MKKLYLLPILFFGSFSILLSQNAIHLVPLAPEGHLVNGREYISLSNDQITVELAYDGTSEENLVFDLVVVNESGRIISVKPASYYYLDLDDPEADSSSYPPKKSVAPEQVYKWYDRALEEKTSKKNTHSFLGFVDAGLGILYSTAAFISTENPVYIVEAVLNTAGTTAHYVGMNRQIEEAMEQKELIRQEMMQETALQPGGVESGFVCFPGDTESAYLMFCFPIENQEFQFVYQLQSEH